MLRATPTPDLLIATPGVAGVDEAGRGPLAGPVVVAAVLLPENFNLKGIQDSKKITPERRNELAQRIRNEAEVSWVAIEPSEIDRLNILGATLVGMTRALDGLGLHVTEALIDGNHAPRGTRQKVSPVVKGDATYAAIAAASIMAKTIRDQIMVEYAIQYPRYGFNRNFGYPTPDHLEALRQNGPCPIHRRSFAPVRAVVEMPGLFDGLD